MNQISKNLTLIGVLISQYFEKKAIAPCKTTNEYSLYLFDSWDYLLRVRCEACHDEKLVAFSCKKRGFCPSCGARRMADSAALLVDEILPHQPMRQWVLSFPFPLRFIW